MGLRERIFGNNLGKQIKVGEPVPLNPEPERDLTQQIKLLPLGPSLEGNQRDLSSEIRIGDEIAEEGELRIVFTDENPEVTRLIDQIVLNPTPGSPVEEQIRLGNSLPLTPNERVSAIENVNTAQEFCNRLRRAMPKLLRPLNDEPPYTENKWFSAGDLMLLADRWQLPLMIFRESEYHWRLALKEPEKYSEGWRVLVYDPMLGAERYLRIERWNPNYQDPDNIQRSSGYANSLAVDRLRAKSYNLSVFGDNQIASNEDLLEAKQVVFQLEGDYSNCGPMCLFMAAVRSGIIGDVKFDRIGRQRLLADLGVKVLSRSEIFEDQPD